MYSTKDKNMYRSEDMIEAFKSLVVSKLDNIVNQVETINEKEYQKIILKGGKDGEHIVELVRCKNTADIIYFSAPKHSIVFFVNPEFKIDKFLYEMRKIGVIKLPNN